jgi:hypothetical protein
MQAADGANELLAVDLFEISLTPRPSNPAIAVLSMESGDADLERVREEAAPWMYGLLTLTDLDPKTLAREPKRAAPIQIATFVVE